MDTTRPELIYVELEEVEGVKRHSFEGLIKHLEQQMDPSLGENVLFFFLTGSRLYGTATKASDWDYVCITKRATREARKSQACLRNGDDLAVASKPFMLTESNVYDMDATLEYYGMSTLDVPEGLRFDVSFYDLRVWTRLAQEQSILPLEAQYMPSAFVLYKCTDFPTYNIDPPVLKTTASLLAGLKFANARPRLNNERNLIKAKKLGALGVRFLQFAIQILEHYRDHHRTANITNWTSIKPIWHELFEMHHPSDYSEFELTFRPTFKALDTQLRQISTYPTLYTIREAFASRWGALKPSSLKLDSLPHILLITPSDTFSPRAYDLLLSYFDLHTKETHTQLHSIKQSIKQFHLIPSFSKETNLLSLATTCNAPIYSNPYLAELHGIIIDCASGRILTSNRFSLLLDLVILKPFLEEDDNTSSELESHAHLKALLEDEHLEVTELYDTFRVALLHHNGEWNVSTIGGSIDASEKIATRTTEGRGPPKTSIRAQFLQMFACARSLPPSSHHEALADLDPSRIYVFDMLTDCSRFVTANKHEQLVFQFCDPPMDTTPKEMSSLPQRQQFTAITTQLSAIKGWKNRLEYLLDYVDLMNPFEQAGLEIRSQTTGIGAKLNARSYWSVRASIGHQNRVLAFNVAADHFEEESLLDVRIYGIHQEFGSTFPAWDAVLRSKIESEMKKLVDFLELKHAAYCTETDRKRFAASIKDVPSPLKSILFDWHNYPFVAACDVLSGLDLGCLRQLRELVELSMAK